MNILLFGGSFDPPHLAHTRMVQILLDRNQFDQVWYVPVQTHDQLFFKQMSGLNHRLAMLKLVQTERTKIETFEIELGEESHTHTTLKELFAKCPRHKFSFLMGSDQLKKLNLWNCDTCKHCFPKCAGEFDYYVYPRVGYDMKLPYQNLSVVEDVEPIDISSTDIRERVGKGDSITKLVDSQVERYIIDHELYT